MNEMNDTASYEDHADQAPGTGDTGTGPDGGPPLLLSHAAMHAAFERGEAEPVGESIGYLMRHRDAWWVLYEDGWLRLIESVVTAQLDQLYPRLAQAEAAQHQRRNGARS